VSVEKAVPVLLERVYHLDTRNVAGFDAITALGRVVNTDASLVKTCAAIAKKEPYGVGFKQEFKTIIATTRGTRDKKRHGQYILKTKERKGPTRK
jgi:hypothetical protein